ncbi:MAG TPA: hypothetical protein VM802_19885 [Chitinophaga sp.]|nr:hypothetical protein [Chitinophaga sp.]HVI47148.1 hypothetical protein [Chitinophaga sp.]
MKNLQTKLRRAIRAQPPAQALYFKYLLSPSKNYYNALLSIID